MANTLKEHTYYTLSENKGHYITYQQILESYGEYNAKWGLSNQDNWTTLKNIISDFRKHLKKQGLDFVYRNGKDAGKGLMLPETNDDPLADLISTHKKMRMKQLERLIKSSKGLFPDSWMANFMDKTLQTDSEQRPIIGFNQNEGLSKINLIPTFFDAIENQKVLSFRYTPGYQEDSVEVVFHPHFIKEFNQRWFVFGKATDREGNPLKYANCAIDRIEEPINEEDMIKYESSDTDWIEFFKPMVGVSRYGNEIVDIVIETQDAKTYGRIVTKRIHKTQTVILPHNESLGQKGLLKISVIPNPELRTMLMSYQEGIKVVSPENYVKKFITHLNNMVSLYK